MLGRPAINPHTGIVGPTLVPARQLRVGDTPATGPVRPIHGVEGVQAALEELARAGIDVQTLLEGGADSLVERALPTATALSDVLERARSAIVRAAPGDALAALDEAWEGAARTEGGWYYRSAALTLLGLPGEADRVLHQGLVRRGGSIALHFLASIVRAAQGDSAGARNALAQAQARRPGDYVLVAWQSVLLARQGDQAGALRLLDPLLAEEPNSSVLSWARQAISVANTESARASLAAQRRVGLPLNVADETPDADWLVADHEALAPLAASLRRLGARFVGSPAVEARQEVRLLLQALSAGGALDRAARPEQIVATRSMLAAMLGVLSREASDAVPIREIPSPRASAPTPRAGLEAQPDAVGRWRLTPAVSMDAQADALSERNLPGARTAVLSALRAGLLSGAAAWLPRVSSVEGEASALVLRHLLAGAHERSAAAAAPPRARVGESAAPGVAESGTRTHETDASAGSSRGDTPPGSHRVVSPSARYNGRVDDALAVPIRIGLSLLQESSARDEARIAVGASVARERAVDSWSDGGRELGAPAYFVGAETPTLSDPRVGALFGTIAAASTPRPSGIGGVNSGDESAASVELARSAGLKLRVLALACMALAFAALVLGHGAVATALAGGASWLALRSSTVAAAARRQERAESAPVASDAHVTDAAPPVTFVDTPR